MPEGGERVVRTILAIAALILAGIAFGLAGTCVIAFIALRKQEKGGEQHDIPYKDSTARADGPHLKAGSSEKDCRTLGGEYGNGR